MNTWARIFLILVLALICTSKSSGATKWATVRADSEVQFQKITGFGGFVCSPTFTYNHMTTSEIQKLWGKNSEAGYNIMRLYIPGDESAWGQTLATAQLAKSLGLIVFASPWTMPAAWKTNGRSEAKYNDTLSYLKEEYYDDYAAYLNRYVSYLKNNGVVLDAISIQNEPDWPATYAGCMWTPAQIAKFLKYYSGVINCRIIAPESVGISDAYVNGLLEDSVCARIGIYAGHQYGGIQEGMKKMQAKGKEVWMTEYLINWNEAENTTRNFNWVKDGFTFASELNKALTANVNAWVHYASKRYYGLMGDGTNGSVTGALTKRGYILSQLARNTIGSTRIGMNWKDDSGILQGTSYLSASGDSVIMMVINSSADTYSLTLDLPFYTSSGKSFVTSLSQNMGTANLAYSTPTFRPLASISPYTVSTFVFVKSGNRVASQMTAAVVHANTIENQKPTSSAFGSSYQLSGKSVTFDHSNALISSNTTASNGYLKLDDQYTRLVLRIASIRSAGSFTSASTTLYYINASGSVNSYNYGTVTFNQNGNSDWVLDISRNVLTDGCTGILGITNGNWNSILTLRLGDVYFTKGNEKSYRFTGIYSKDDSDLLDALEDVNTASSDFSAVTAIPENEDWSTLAANKNGLYYVSANVVSQAPNVVNSGTVAHLSLNASSGCYSNPSGLVATAATLQVTLNGNKFLVVPFNTTIPSGVKAFSLNLNGAVVECRLLPEGTPLSANTPVLLNGNGEIQFTGTGIVQLKNESSARFLMNNGALSKAPVGSFVLVNSTDSVLSKVVSGSEPVTGVFDVYCWPLQPFTGNSMGFSIPATSIHSAVLDDRVEFFYDLSGRKVLNPQKGVFVRNGKKYLFKP